MDLKTQLANIAKQYSNGSGTLANGKDVKRVLQEEGQRLYNIIQKHIDKYYASYSPVEYERTYMFKESLRVDPVQMENGQWSIKVYFDDILATHDSIIGGDSGNVPILLNYGWQTTMSPPRYRFTAYEGSNFLSDAIEEYSKSNPYGIKISLRSEWNGQLIENRDWY